MIQLASPLLLSDEKGDGFRMVLVVPLPLFQGRLSMGGGDGDGDDEEVASNSAGESSAAASSRLPPISASFQIDRKGRIREGELDPFRD